MSETRPPLTASLSFDGSASTSAIPRPLKRQLTSTPELSFFTPAAQSFKPRPYTPNGTFEASSTPSPVTRNTSLASLAMPTPMMEPSPSDPHALFIHPPFDVFPDSHMYPGGLSYSLLAAHPEWFLHAADFITSTSTNPDAIPYPSQLEPPRGWCPAKKKDLKERGSDGWPEGEEPRLRCTFCRRTYAGVNAKSMWRRHVFEKHKIAMANRRDSNERVRGRSSNKENKQHAPGKENGDIHSKVVSMTAVPQQQPEFTIVQQTKPKYRPLLPADSACAKAALTARIGRSNERDRVTFPSAPVIPEKEFSARDDDHPHSSTQSTFPMSPPLTPRTPLQVDFNEALDSAPTHPIFPSSPYDPTATPTFRHCPPTLPWDQPWRFPSPSHPLHSRARELSLSMLTAVTASPAAKGVESSPSILPSSPIASPSVNTATESSYGAMRPSPKTLFLKGQLPVPITEGMNTERHRRRVQESPLSRIARPRHSSLRTVSEAAHGWLSDAPLSSSPCLIRSASDGLLDGSVPLDVQDPFANIYRPWSDIGGLPNVPAQDIASPPLSSPEADSPVLRTNVLPNDENVDGSKPTMIGLGIGLMEPFGFFGRAQTELYGLALPSLGGEPVDENEAALSSFAYEHVGGYERMGGRDPASPSRKKRRTINT